MSVERDSGDTSRKLKAQAGRLLVRSQLLLRGISPFGLDRVWEYTDDCAGIKRHRPSDPRQNPVHFMRGLAADAWSGDLEALRGPAHLEARSDPIRAEAARLERQSGLADDPGELVSPGWRVHFLRCLGEDLKRPGGPAIQAALEATRRHASTGHAYVAQLDANTKSPPWTGPTNTRVRIHLGLDLPPEGDFGLEVAGEARRWTAGRCLAFDDSFVHRAWNATDHPVRILVVDVWHPEMSDHEATAMETFMRLSPKSVRDRQAVRDGLRD